MKEKKTDKNRFREILEEAIKVLTGNDTGLRLDFEATAQAIENILEENENLKQAIEINKNLYQEVCNKNKKLEELVEYLRRSCERKDETIIEAQQECIECQKLANSIPKSLIKEKIEKYQQLQNNYIEKYDEANQCIDGMINVLQELLGEEK